MSDLGNRLEGSGLNDERLFLTVKTLLLEKHQRQMAGAKKDKVLIHQIVTLLRTLASSGDYQYIQKLQKILEESDNRNRAKHVTQKIGFYLSRNQIMQDMSAHQDGQSLHSTRLLNLLNDNNYIMKRYAAEVIVRQKAAEPVVQELIASQLEEKVRQGGTKLEIDTLAWYCKVLGTVNKEKYRGMLVSISTDKSISSKIRRHTKKILKS
ncbi:MAG: hypothetical protein ACRBBW_09560 [Cellvibrionaceae bacterium]